MSTALTTTQENEVAIPSDVSVGALEMAIGSGDFSRFSPGDKLRFLNLTCQSLKLNPLTLPIRIIKMDGREVMYATAECSAQLAYRDKVSIKKIEEKTENGCYVVRVVASSPDGRTHEDIGLVEMTYPDKAVEWKNGQKVYVTHPQAGKPLAGKEYANAVMKCHTKASRRAILRICSLGIPDESELDEIPRAQVSSVATVSGAIEDSVQSRAERANQVIEAETILDGGLRPPASADTKASPSKPLSQEPKSLETKVQPPIEVTAPAGAGSPVLQGEQNPISENEPAASDDFDDPPSQQQTEEEKKAADLEAVFGTAKAPLNPLDCYEYLIAKKQLVRGAGLETVPAIYALKVVSNAGGFMRSVEAWVKGGRK